MRLQKTESIDNNPVKPGYVSDPTQWRYACTWNHAKNESLVAVKTE